MKQISFSRNRFSHKASKFEQLCISVELFVNIEIPSVFTNISVT